jgi:hypothetical protein
MVEPAELCLLQLLLSNDVLPEQLLRLRFNWISVQRAPVLEPDKSPADFKGGGKKMQKTHMSLTTPTYKMNLFRAGGYGAAR